MSEHDPSPADFLADPLSSITRNERRNLLLAATLGVLAAKAGLIPTQLSALGISLTAPNQSVLIIVVACTVLYFLGAFLLYGLADFLIWRKKYQEYLEQVEGYNQNWTQADQADYDQLRENVPDVAWVYRQSKPVAFARLTFEFFLPLVFGIYVVIILGLQVCCH